MILGLKALCVHFSGNGAVEKYVMIMIILICVGESLLYPMSGRGPDSAGRSRLVSNVFKLLETSNGLILKMIYFHFLHSITAS